MKFFSLFGGRGYGQVAQAEGRRKRRKDEESDHEDHGRRRHSPSLTKEEASLTTRHSKGVPFFWNPSFF